MKTIEVTFTNGETAIKRVIKTSANLDLSKVVGTVCSDLFRLVSLQDKTKTKLFSLSKPFEMRVITDNDVVIDTTKISSEFKTRFKLNNTAKRKRAFAKTVYTVIEFVSTKTKVVTVENLERKLEREIIDNELAV